MATPPLYGLHVVVTRPCHQAGNFVDLLQKAGAIAHTFPLLQIEPVKQAPTTLKELSSGTYDLVIFISANAVIHALACLPPYTHWQNTRIAAIGKQTAQTLQNHHLPVALFPAQGFRSEDLLELPDMHNLQAKNILIVRGQGGREFLADSLRERGANVEYANVYQRCQAQQNSHFLIHLHQQSWLGIICITSSESLTQLLRLVTHDAVDNGWIQNVPLLVGSERTAQDASAAGFKQIISAANPSDEAMLQALLYWQNHHNKQDA